MIEQTFKLSNTNKKIKDQIVALVQIACKYVSDIRIESENINLNAKSIMRIGELQPGDSVQIKINGKDEEDAMSDFTTLFTK